METLLSKIENTIKIPEKIEVEEYKLMYLWGAWITKVRIYAENDDEAIFDAAEHAKNLMNWPYSVALFCGNRLVKRYK